MTVTVWGEAVAAGVAALLAILGFVIGRWHGRREAVRRLSSITSRLRAVTYDLEQFARASDSESRMARPADPAGFESASRLEAVVSSLQSLSETAVETVSNAVAEATRLRGALDVVPQGVVLRDERGTPAFRNTRATALLDSRHSDLLAARAVEEQLDATAPGKPGEQTLELYGPPRRTLVVHTAPLDDGRRSLGVAAVFEDVSERRRLEFIRRDFVANVSHELKTPVAALGLLAETLLAEKDPAVSQRLAGRIQTEAYRVSRIIEDLLDLSRIEAEEAPPRDPVPVHLVLAEAVDRVRGLAEDRAIRLEVHEPEAPTAILGDRRQLVSAVHNLLENAVNYSDDGSPVIVGTTVQADEIEIFVRDHGIGIPARDMERIFERFYRVDQGRSRATGGTGLGLAIVRHVASNHGGRVTVASREGEGSTFTLHFPRTQEA